MDKQPTSPEVARLISTAMRPYDEVRERPVVGGRRGGFLKSNKTFSKVRALAGHTDILLNLICVLFALVFLGLAVMNAGSMADIFTIDGLFFSVVCLLLAGVFLVSPALMLKEKGWLKRPSFAGASGEAFIDEGPIHFEGSTRLFMSVLGWLLGLTLVEVLLAYFHVPLYIMLTILIGLSLIKAALIVAYFMHLRFERLSLVLTLVPILVICVCLLFVFFPDSIRSLNLRPAQTRGAEISAK